MVFRWRNASFVGIRANNGISECPVYLGVERPQSLQTLLELLG